MARDDSTWAADAEAHLVAGRLGDAEAACARQLEQPSRRAEALGLLGFVRMKQGRWGDAESMLRAAAALAPDSVNLLASQARLCLMLGKLGEAVAPLQACAWRSSAVRPRRWLTSGGPSWSPSTKRRALRALRRDGEARDAPLPRRRPRHPQPHEPRVAEPAQAGSGGASPARLVRVPDYATFCASGSLEVMRGWRGNTFFNAGLDRFVVPDLEIERGLTFARRWLTAPFLGPAPAPETHDDRGAGVRPRGLIASSEAVVSEWLPLLCTIARYAFLTEYVLAVEAEDRVPADGEANPPSVVAKIAKIVKIAEAARVAAWACYRPLSTHPDARRLASLSDDPAFRDLVRLQVDEPFKERKLEATLPTLAPIADGVSREVRAQYEENPYPRWLTVGRMEVSAPVAAQAKGKQILVAGCGTGREAIETALIFPAARVDAVDLSRASLAYAVRKARELGTRNLFLIQGDVLELRRLKKKFDLVACSGVLHHMEDPRAGLRACLEVLRPGGVLKIALYSRAARREITAARAWATHEGFAPTRAGIRAFRAAVKERPADDPMRRRLVAWEDFYALSACRDLVFHVREHTFDLPEIAGLVAENGLEVVQVDIKNPVHRARYRERFPEDPEAVDLMRWHQLEAESPTMFAAMVSLWLCRSADALELDLGWLKSTGRM